MGIEHPRYLVQIVCVLMFATVAAPACFTGVASQAPTASPPLPPLRPARPVGLALRAGVVLEGETSLCCLERLSPPDAETQVLRGCVVIAHDEHARMRCYEDGFEAAVSPHRLQVGKGKGNQDEQVKILPAGFGRDFVVESHTCRAVIMCPGQDDPLTCEARGRDAHCAQDQKEGVVVCVDGQGEQTVRCPKPKSKDETPPAPANPGLAR